MDVLVQETVGTWCMHHSSQDVRVLLVIAQKQCVSITQPSLTKKQSYTYWVLGAVPMQFNSILPSGCLRSKPRSDITCRKQQTFMEISIQISPKLPRRNPPIDLPSILAANTVSCAESGFPPVRERISNSCACWMAASLLTNPQCATVLV